MRRQLDAWEADLEQRERDMRFIVDEINEFAENLSSAEDTIDELTEKYKQFDTELDELERSWVVAKEQSSRSGRRPRPAPADGAAIASLLRRLPYVRAREARREMRFLQQEREGTRPAEDR
jgi:chromosome segregation ATPase